jgi:hypothetical protein
MTPTDGPPVEADVRAQAPRLAEQLRAIERALEERRDAESGWLREYDARFPDEDDRH